MILFASDHAGCKLKQFLIRRIWNIVKMVGKITQPHDTQYLIDVGSYDETPVDYPFYAHKLSLTMKSKDDIGILICGTGIGMSIAANRHSNIRCALATNVEMAIASREHNDANVLALGARVLDETTAFNIMEAFISTDFTHEERHIRRISQINYDFSSTTTSE